MTEWIGVLIYFYCLSGLLLIILEKDLLVLLFNKLHIHPGKLGILFVIVITFLCWPVALIVLITLPLGASINRYLEEMKERISK